MKTLAFSLLFACGLAQAATIYKYVDPQGNVTYTNVPIRGAQPIKLNPLSSYPGQKAKPRGGSASADKPAASGGYPSVDADTQKQRDGGRKKILEQELANEAKALDAAKKALADGKAVRLGDEARNYQKYLDRVQKLQNEVTDREKNVAALKKELGLP
ncbi:DUF4124 domain-containing protein [Chromobacterium phragmitis]|uniref:DUF4124 domain-containing protein n=1 Tax=Chromobacterium phragmitis TaxID=2202141 RepID=A0A344UGD6_9NEIS|nr:DUF4124 domain-containing protein [Chromobacterium phragmitis]AXE28974.1 DUF4124 domain-containing protein [Chromobacterium phragmitis]AXE34334.1 DUF4124 domain-containing protein [Chromobacterium phragmitis]